MDNYILYVLNDVNLTSTTNHNLNHAVNSSLQSNQTQLIPLIGTFSSAITCFEKRNAMRVFFRRILILNTLTESILCVVSLHRCICIILLCPSLVFSSRFFIFHSYEKYKSTLQMYIRVAGSFWFTWIFNLIQINIAWKFSSSERAWLTNDRSNSIDTLRIVFPSYVQQLFVRKVSKMFRNISTEEKVKAIFDTIKL